MSVWGGGCIPGMLVVVMVLVKCSARRHTQAVHSISSKVCAAANSTTVQTWTACPGSSRSSVSLILIVVVDVDLEVVVVVSSLSPAKVSGCVSQNVGVAVAVAAS